jgi:hypothetical protein
MLFDHGCDAFSVGLTLTASSKLVGMGDSVYTFLFVSGGITAFHFVTLEEYYTGTLILGPFNAVSDFCPIQVAIMLSMAIYTNSYWQYVVYNQDYFWDGSKPYRVIDIFVCLSWFIQACTVLMW